MDWRRENPHVLLQQQSWQVVSCSSWARAVSTASSRWGRNLCRLHIVLHTACMAGVGRFVQPWLPWLSHHCVETVKVSRGKSVERGKGVDTNLILHYLNSKKYIKIMLVYFHLHNSLYNCFILQMFGEPRIPSQPKMFWNTINTSYSPSLLKHQHQDHTNNPSASWWAFKRIYISTG